LFVADCGYFVLDSATNNDTAIAVLSKTYDFNPTHRRLRCGPHKLNLVGQAIIFSTNRDAYDNVAEQHTTEEAYMQEWRQQGPLGVLIGIINHIKTSQQYVLFRGFQQTANLQLPAKDRLKVLEPVDSSLWLLDGTRIMPLFGALPSSKLPTTCTPSTI
jgi:hypothetical protein